MAIYTIVGKMGHGKGLFAMHVMQQAWRRGRWIATNMELTPKAPWYDQAIRFGTPDFPIVDKRSGQPFWDLLPRGTDVIVDEAELAFDSVNHRTLNDLCCELIANQRKLNLNLFFVVKRIGNLYVRFRESADTHFVCEWSYKRNPFWSVAERVLGRDLKRYTNFRISEFGDSDLKEEQRKTVLSYKTCATRYFNYYKTEQLFKVER